MRDFAGNVTVLGNDVSFSKTFFRIAEDVVVFLFDVVWALRMNPVTLGFYGIFRIKPGGQRFIFDINQVERLLSEGLRDGDDAGNIIADVADFFHGESGFIMADGKNAVFVGRVGAGNN